MPNIQNSIFIQAPVDDVFRVAMDVERFPEFMPDLKSLRVLERSDDGLRTVVEWVGNLPEFKTTVKWVEEDLWDAVEHTCRFTLVRGDFKSYGGTWRFTPEAGGTRFDSDVHYEYDIPLIGPLIKGLIRKKMHENVDRLQAAMKARMEGGAEA
jgi:ribosome-associated toxin RatA of RatAB toxin-antitoxin module